jgi:hypothetical protein
MNTKVIHRKDALRMLESGEPCTLRLWKMSTGEILEYKGARCVGSHWRGGTHSVRLPLSGLIRTFRDVALFEINGFKIYM